MQESSIVDIRLKPEFNRLQRILLNRNIKSEIVKGNVGNSRFQKFTHMQKIKRDEILKLVLPVHMVSRKTHIALKEKIEENNNLDLLLKEIDYDNIIINNINELNARLLELKSHHADFNSTYFITGSAGWNNLFNKHYNDNILSVYEKSAIHNVSYDLYYFINDTKYKSVFNRLINTTISNINTLLNDQLERKGFSNIKLSLEHKSIDFNKYVIFPSERFAIKLEYSKDIPDKKQKSKSKTTAPKNVKATPAPTTTRSGRVIKVKQTTGGAQKTSKTIYSIDICASDNNIVNEMIIENITKNLIIIGENRLQYLNLYGIYIFIELFKKNTFLQNKGYNHFKIREHIFNTHILKDANKSNILFNIAMIYYNTFLNTYLFDKELFKTLLKLFITANPEMNNFINTMEANIIEKLRPYINYTILNINRHLNDMNEKLGIFVAGGDATRRYKNDITVTKDIDTKIYIPVDLKDSKQDIENIVVDELLKLCAYLINVRSTKLFNMADFPHILTASTDDDEYIYTANFIINETTDPNLLNFRFRQIFKGNFPVDLISLDYRCKIIYSIKHKASGKEFEFLYKYDIAFLDVVLEVLNDNINYYNKYSVLSNGLPICGLDFLLKDLQNTYTSETSSLLRFLGGKNEKDYQRYIDLNIILKMGKIKFNHDRSISENSNYKSNTSKRQILDAYEDFTINTSTDETYNLIKRCYYYSKVNGVKNNKIALSYNKEELFKILPEIAQFGGTTSDLDINKLHIDDNYDNYSYEIDNNDTYIDSSTPSSAILKDKFITITDEEKYDLLINIMPMYNIKYINKYDNNIFDYYYKANYFFNNNEKMKIIESTE